MKRIISALAPLLAVCLALSGCASMLERTYAGSETHVDYPVVEDDSTLRVETYQGLVNAFLYYVNEHSYAGAVRLYNYPGQPEDDLERARAQVMGQDPLAAWAVRDITCDVTRILTYYEVDVRISYTRTAQEMADVLNVFGQAGLNAELERLADERESRAVLLLSGFTGNAAQAEELFRLAWYGDPARSNPAPPEFAVTFYPEEGNRRVAELAAAWGSPAAGSEDYATQLATAAAQLLESNPPADGAYTVEELAAILRDNAVYDAEGDPLALAALTGEAASEKGLILAMEHLCRQVGIEASPVLGGDGSLWLIVNTPEGYRHLPARGLLPRPEPEDPEAEPEPILYTDNGMRALGFTWNDALYPPCPEAEAAGPPAPEGQ